MEITVHTRHLDIPAGLREAAVEKGQHLERFLEGTQRVEIVFSQDHAARDNGHVTCEISVVAAVASCASGRAVISRILRWRLPSPRRRNGCRECRTASCNARGLVTVRWASDQRSLRTERPPEPRSVPRSDRGSHCHREDCARPRAGPVVPGPVRAGLGRRDGRVPRPRPWYSKADA